MSEFEATPIGADPDLNEAIKIVFETVGFEVNDPEDIKLIESAIRKKLYTIIANAKFHAGYAASLSPQQKETDKALHLTDLKKALQEEKIKIDRPEFILQQPQSKIANKRSRPK